MKIASAYELSLAKYRLRGEATKYVPGFEKATKQDLGDLSKALDKVIEVIEQGVSNAAPLPINKAPELSYKSSS